MSRSKRVRLTSQLKYVRLFPDNAAIVRGKSFYSNLRNASGYIGTSTYSMLTVDRRRLLQWTYFAELSTMAEKGHSLLLPDFYSSSSDFHSIAL